MPDRAFIDELADVWQSTTALCRDLAPSDWDTPTDCPGWSVRDQLSHLIGVESVLLGRPAPPPAPTGLAHVINPIGEMNEAWIEARRPLAGNELVAEWEEVAAARLAALRAMTDEELEADTPSPIGMVPYATFMDVRIMDCWVHEQDIRRAVGRSGGFDSPAAATALRRLAATLGFVVGKRAGAPEGATVAVELSGPQAQVLVIGVRDGRAKPVPLEGEPTVRIAMDTETFVCLVGGRRAAADVKVSFDGDEELGQRIVANMATLP